MDKKILAKLEDYLSLTELMPSDHEHQLLKPLGEALERFKVAFKEDFSPSTNVHEASVFLDVLKLTLSANEYLGDSQISNQLIRERITRHLPFPSCQNGCTCQSCEDAKKLIDSFVEFYRTRQSL